MIRELNIKNFALIDDVSVSFDDGFTVLTGETGAGKSILVGAIGLMLGDRASAESIRSGADEAEVTGMFSVSSRQKILIALLKEFGVELDEGSVILRRIVARSGRNRIYANQVPIPLGTLKQIGDLLVDFHGQHEHQSLLQIESAVRLIDSLPEVATAKNLYTMDWQSLYTAQSALVAHDAAAAQLAARKDLIEFQYSEIAKLNLKIGEEAGLLEELQLLSSATQRTACVGEIAELLSADETGVTRLSGGIAKRVEQLVKWDSSVTPWVEQITAAQTTFTELERFCARYLGTNGGETDTDRLDAINERLSKIQRLQKKYSCTFDGLIEKATQLTADLEKLTTSDADRGRLEHEVSVARKKCDDSGKKLGTARKKFGALFDDKITQFMKKLGFSGGLWETAFAQRPEPDASGYESVEFLVRTNTGEPIMPLVKIASGGELSRLMLAIKTIFAAQDQIPVLIFDEIDTGIGGMLAHEVANAVKKLSASHQVFCISHLHQIAAVADHHCYIYKKVAGGRTVTRVESLEGEKRVEEIARMLGGESGVAMEHARELLKGQ